QYMDNLGRVVRSSTYAGSDSIASITGYTFLNQPFRSVAPKGDSTRYTYDFLGRLKQKNNADEGISKYVYDKGGRLRFMVDSVGAAADPPIVLYWKYDNLGRAMEKGELVDESWGDGSAWQSYADNSPSQPSSSSSWRKKYRYDALGRLDSVLTNSDDYDAAEVIEHFGYNKFGNIVTKTVKVVSYSSSTTYTTTYSYDLLGRVRQIDLPTSKWEDVSVTYVYDQLGRVSQVGRLGSDPVANYTYGSGGQMATEVLNPSGGSGSKTRTFTYNAQGLLTGISNSLFSESLSYSSGGYSSNEGFYHGLIASSSVSYYAGGPSSLTYSYQYDNFGRLIVADNTLSDMDVGVGSGTTYDANGNITSIKRGPGSTQTYAYYSGTNRVQNTDGSGNDYTYNESGSVISSTPKSISAIAYDPFTQMTMSETKSGTTTSYQYDANKVRVYREASGVRTVYLYGLEDYPVMTKTSAGVEKVFVYGPTGLIAMRDDESWYYVHKDHLGSTRLLSDESGNAVTTYDYDAMGTKRRVSVNVEAPYQFTGQERDEEVQLYNFRVRMYDSDLGYFYAPDPAHKEFSPYNYASNNPVGFVDPSGMESEAAALERTMMYQKNVEQQFDSWTYWQFGGGMDRTREESSSESAGEADPRRELAVRNAIENLSDEEIRWMKAAVGGEASTYEEMVNIAYVLINRLLDGFGVNMIDVISKPGQVNGFFNEIGQYVFTGQARGIPAENLPEGYSKRAVLAAKSVNNVLTGVAVSAIGTMRYFGSDRDVNRSSTRLFQIFRDVNAGLYSPIHNDWRQVHIGGTWFFDSRMLHP
ncbi:MAG: RHS repeat-associated core domain-containing protein, partial [Bacteroidota bacterium]